MSHSAWGSRLGIARRQPREWQLRACCLCTCGRKCGCGHVSCRNLKMEDTWTQRDQAPGLRLWSKVPCLQVYDRDLRSTRYCVGSTGAIVTGMSLLQKAETIPTLSANNILIWPVTICALFGRDPAHSFSGLHFSCGLMTAAAAARNEW